MKKIMLKEREKARERGEQEAIYMWNDRIVMGYGNGRKWWDGLKRGQELEFSC